MMFDRPPHRGMLPIGNAKFLGRLLYDLGQRTIVSVADERAQMMDDMVIKPACKPADERLSRRVVGRCREDVIDAIVKLAAAQGKISGVNTVSGLEHEGHAQTDDQMGEQERQGDQQRRFSQQHDRQDQHVGKIESFPGKKDDVFSHRMLRLFQIVMGGEEEALKVPHEDIVERKHRVKQKGVDVLEPLQRRSGFVRRKSKDAASGKRVVFAVEIDAGVVAPMMEDPPHVGANSTDVENIVQGFVDRPHRGDGVVVAVVGDIQQKEGLCDGIDKV